MLGERTKVDYNPLSRLANARGRKKHRADAEDSWGTPRNREVVGKRRYILRLCVVFLQERKGLFLLPLTRLRAKASFPARHTTRVHPVTAALVAQS